jgi:SAM-dependent methyltransferase
MKDHEDAYGHELFDYYTSGKSYEIIERDDGYVDISSGAKAYFAEQANWRSHEKQAIRLARGRILDVGCGAGRHSLYLQGRGHDVTGIDISPLAVKVCKLRGLKDARVMSITRVSSKLGTFDTILMLGNNFGLFGSMKRARWLLRRFRALTSGYARIIAESAHVYQTTNPHHLAYHRRNRKRGRMPGQIRIRTRYQTYTSPWFDYLLVSQDEMKKLLRGTGWHVERFIEADGPMYIAIIEKD